ncbi:MAG TPA: prepilin-type N-terminal cleavage/methylation domain-containing protein [Cellvibrio sp.]|nr:prepilin-type N-terminal cleavage/methylation domain-containing protein [Cellvibrio sp.]
MLRLAVFKNCAFKNSLGGFTLIEMIAVIVILSILAAMGGALVVESTKSYQSSQTRTRLVNTGRQAIERMSRQLRIALPYSVRLTNSNQCIEFMPIASGGSYLGLKNSDDTYSGYVPDLINGGAALASLDVSPHSIEFGTAQFVSIGAMAANEVYGVNPGSRAVLASRSSTQLTLSAAKVWQRNSLNKRFYLLNNPQAFCVVNNELRFYDNQDATAVADPEVTLSSTYSLLADNVTAATPFALTAGSENRNTIVQINIAFAHKVESVTFNHSVMIRNVP